MHVLPLVVVICQRQLRLSGSVRSLVERDVAGEEDPPVRVSIHLEPIRLLTLVLPVPEEDALDRLGLMLLVRSVVGVGDRSEYAEVCEGRLLTVECLVGGLAVEGGGRSAVDEVRRVAISLPTRESLVEDLQNKWSIGSGYERYEPGRGPSEQVKVHCQGRKCGLK